MEQTQATSQQTYNPTLPAPRPRSLERRDAKLAGVAGGLGAYFDIDPTIIRVLLIAATLVSGPVVPLFYVAAWIIMPQAGDVRPAPPAPAPPPATAQPTTTTPAPGSWATAPAPAAATTPATYAAGDSTGDDMKVAAQQN